MPIRSYRDLQVWQKGVELSLQCYRLSRAFPSDERFGLTSQIRRASVSIPSNIAEGHGRWTKGEYRNSLSSASGSLAELETQLIIVRKLDYASRAELESADELCDAVSRMLTNLRRRLREGA